MVTEDHRIPLKSRVVTRCPLAIMNSTVALGNELNFSLKESPVRRKRRCTYISGCSRKYVAQRSALFLNVVRASAIDRRGISCLGRI